MASVGLCQIELLDSVLIVAAGRINSHIIQVRVAEQIEVFRYNKIVECYTKKFKDIYSMSMTEGPNTSIMSVMYHARFIART